MDPEQFENLIANLPKWATEETLVRIVYDASRDLQTNINGVNKIANQLGLEEVTVNVMEAIHNRDKLGKKFRRNMAGIRKDIDKTMGVMRATDPIQGFSEIAELAGGAIGGAGTAIQKFTNFMGKKINAAGDVIGTVARGTGKGVVGMSAFTGAVAPLVMIQEKNLRAMMDYGFQFSDGTGGFTRMRHSAANMGMGIAEMMKATQGFNVVAANTGEGLGEQQINFNDMIAGLGNLSRQDAGFNQFGLNATQFAEAMSGTANMMYQLGELENLSVPNRRKMIETFTNTQKVALGMADLTGISRTALLENGLSAEANISIRGNLLRQKEFIEEKYGEDVATQIELNANFLQSSITSLLPVIGPESEKVITAFISNITSTQEVLPSMTPELMEIFAMMDGPAQREFVSMFQDALTGQVDRKALALRVRDFANVVANAEYKSIGRNSGQAVEGQNRLISEARAIAADFRNASDEEILQRIEDAGKRVEGADDSIEAIEGTKVALRRLQDRVAPGFGTMATVFGGLHGALENFGDKLKELGFIDSFETGTRLGDNLDATSTQAQELARQGKLEVPEGYGGVFDPNALPDEYFEGLQSNIGLETGNQNVRRAPTIDFNEGYTPDPDTPPLAIQDVVDQRQIGQNKFRSRELSPSMLEVLQHAAMVVHPQMRVVVTSGGQMSLAEWEASTEQKSKRGNEYFINGRKARKGSRRHDGGNAADFELHLDGERLNIDNPHFVDFIQAAFALGAKGGSAGHDYMGSYRAHLDLVGTAYGGALTWSNPTQGFMAAQASGLEMQNTPGANMWRERLEQVIEAEEDRLEAEEARNQTIKDGNIPVVNPESDDGTQTTSSDSNHDAFTYQIKDSDGNVLEEFDTEAEAKEYVVNLAKDQDREVTEVTEIPVEVPGDTETVEGSNQISVSGERTTLVINIAPTEDNVGARPEVTATAGHRRRNQERDQREWDDQYAGVYNPITGELIGDGEETIVISAVPDAEEDSVYIPQEPPQGYFEERKAEIQALIDAENERIQRSEAGENFYGGEYFGPEGMGRERSRERITELLYEMSALVRKYNRDSTEAAAN